MNESMISYEEKTALSSQLCEMQDLLKLMADQMRAQTEKINRLEKEVRLLQPVTALQVKSLNAAIRKRADEAATQYRLPENARAELAAAIRKALREANGTRTTRETARCEYEVTLARIETWDDYTLIKKIRKREAGR